MKSFPVSFTHCDGDGGHSDAIIVDQTHHEELRDGVKQYTAKVTIEREGETIVIPITVTEGPRKNATSQLTLSIEDTRQLVQHLSEAIKDAEEYVEYLATQK
jgi:hypothetical protein